MTLKSSIKEPAFICSVVSVVLNGALWATSLYLFPHSNPVAILHYNTSVGIDFIGSGSQITVIPIIGSALVVANILLAFLLRHASKQSAALFWAPLPLIQIILLVSLLLILRLNT